MIYFNIFIPYLFLLNFLINSSKVINIKTKKETIIKIINSKVVFKKFSIYYF